MSFGLFAPGYKPITKTPKEILENKICDCLQSYWAVGLETMDFVLVHNIKDISDISVFRQPRKHKHIDVMITDFGEIQLVKNTLVKEGEFIIVPKNYHLKHQCPTCGQKVN